MQLPLMLFFTKLMKSKVKWFNNEKGYGFIEIGAGVGEDVFVQLILQSLGLFEKGGMIYD